MGEKQASVGKLAGGVAHEINNPLTGIFTFTHMLLKRNDLPEEVRSDLEVIAQETERVRKIVKGLLDFSRQTELNREPTDVNRLVRHTLSLVENQALIKGIDLTFQPGEELPMINPRPKSNAECFAQYSSKCIRCYRSWGKYQRVDRDWHLG